MQENNNFESIISTWRRLSGEQIETAIVSMSGDSTDTHPYKKKEEETDLLGAERGKAANIPSVATASTVPEAPDNTASTNPEEKQEFIRRDKEETREAAGDTNEKDIKNDSDYLDNDRKPSKNKWDKEDLGSDKVDSVYLRPPPLQKPQSNTSTQAEEEDCGIKCLYYTLQCCDCVLQ